MRSIDIQPLPGVSPGPGPGSAGGGGGLALVLCASMAVFGLIGWRFAEARMQGRVQPKRPITVGQTVTREDLARRADLHDDEKGTIELFQRLSPAVVNVTNLTLRRDLFSRDVTEVPHGTGSGFVWDGEGHVVTNYHVIASNSAVDVTFAGDTKAYRARVVGMAPQHDLAVLRLVDPPRKSFAHIELGESANLLVGQRVLAIGNPFGLDQTLTTGVISGLGREIRSPTEHRIADVIQTDAAINPGNSGGPLFDSQGRLIGINTAIVSPSGAYAGIGFAVPVDVLKEAVPLLIRSGVVVRPGLGVATLLDSEARMLGIEGVGVRTVEPGSAAARAGLRSARQLRDGSYSIDVIVAVDDDQVRSRADLLDALSKHAVGDEVLLTLRRGAQAERVRVELQALE